MRVRLWTENRIILFIIENNIFEVHTFLLRDNRYLLLFYKVFLLLLFSTFLNLAFFRLHFKLVHALKLLDQKFNDLLLWVGPFKNNFSNFHLKLLLCDDLDGLVY
jgi:hypothetical protein